MPDTVPVNVGSAIGAFKSRAVCAALETGLLASEVLSTFARPTSVFVKPEGVLIVGSSMSCLLIAVYLTMLQGLLCQ